MTNDRLLKRIRAILAKADPERNPNEHERMVALEAAQSLLIKHGLTLDDIGEEETSSNPHGHRRLFVTEKDDQWIGHLAYRIGHVYWCEVYRSPRSDGSASWHIIGRQDYADFVEMIVEYVAPQIRRELDRALASMDKRAQYAREYAIQVWLDNRDEGDTEMPSDDILANFGKDEFEGIRLDHGGEAANADIAARCGVSKTYATDVRPFVRRGELAPAVVSNVGVWRRSFLDQAVAHVAARLRAMRDKDVKAAGSAGNALVRNEKDALAKFKDSLDLGLRSNRSERKVDYNGALAGRDAAQRADLTPGNKMPTGPGRNQLGAGS